MEIVDDLAYVGTDLLHFDAGWQWPDHPYSRRLPTVEGADDFASMAEVLFSKALFASVLSVLMGVVTLVINQAFSGEILGIVLALMLGTFMLVEVGLIMGLWVKDMNTLYAWIKAGGLLIVLPGLIALFPTLPQWISMLAPTYYFLQPIYDLSVGGATLTAVLPTLGICLLIGLALLPVLWWSAVSTEQRRLQG